jgi:hypothetical protein
MKKILVLWLLVGISVLAEEERPLSGGAEIHWQQFTGMLKFKAAKKVVIYIGTPRRRDKDPKPAEPTVTVADFEFYRKPHEATSQLAEELTKLVSDPQSFIDYRGTKLCGGFHPDLCIEWQFEQDGQRWHSRAFVCLSCHEWRLIDNSSAVHADMTKTAADELVRITHALNEGFQKR